MRGNKKLSSGKITRVTLLNQYKKKMMILDTAYIYIALLEDESIKSRKNRVGVSLI